MKRQLHDYLVLDALSYDMEDLDGILSIINSPTEIGWLAYLGRPISEGEVALALRRCFEDALVIPRIGSPDGRSLTDAAGGFPTGPLEGVWFELTPRGQLVIDNWEPPAPTPF